LPSTAKVSLLGNEAGDYPDVIVLQEKSPLSFWGRTVDDPVAAADVESPAGAMHRTGNLGAKG
jgi:hypothetical protein